MADIPRRSRGVIPLRPLSAAEILDAPFAAMRRYVGPMLGMSFLVGLLLEGVELVWSQWLRASATDRFGIDTATAIGFGVALLWVVIALAAAGWLTALTAAAVLGRDADARSVWATVRPRIWTLLGAALLAVLPPAVWVGFLALFTVAGGLTGIMPLVLFPPVVWAAVVALFLTPVVVLEHAGVRAAIKRAVTLVRGYWWRCAGILILAGIVSTVAAAAVLLPFTVGAVNFLSGGFATVDGESQLGAILAAVGGTLSYALAMPVSAGVVAVLYLDLRIRTEAFDLTLARTAR